ncbi:MAG: hypothetical protein MI919_03320 [Holophagales bacterium]|nr:hypothetical protein [Holophagales bacterium]
MRYPIPTSLTLLAGLALLVPLRLEAEIRRDPNGVNVNAQGATSVFITFGGLDDQVPAEAFWCGALQPAAPDIGFRCDPSTLFGRLPIRFDRSRLDATGSVFTDIMTIPPSVARRAYQAAAQGETSSFFYVRRFVSRSGGPDEYVFVTCRLTGGGARTPLALLDVQLHFADRATVTTVAPGGAPPPIEAELSYNGTGRLIGRWEVVRPTDDPPTSDDLLTEATLPQELRASQRRYTQVARFNVFLPPVGSLRLEGPPVDRLPTDTEGLYQVLLRIEASEDKESSSNLGKAGAGAGVVQAGAVAGFPLPVLRYFVGSGAGSEPIAEGFRLLGPADGATLTSASSATFSWQ